MRKISLFIFLSFFSITLMWGQRNTISRNGNNSFTEILESPVYKKSSKKISKTNSLGITKFYNSSKEEGYAETITSGAIKFYNNKSEYLGMAEQKPTHEVHVYDKNNRKIAIIEQPGKDGWVNNVFWTFFY